MSAKSKNNKTLQLIKRILNMKEVTLIFVMLIFVVLFQILNRNYLSLSNVRNILNSAFVMGTLAVGLSCLLISGKIDLSVTNTGVLAGIIIAILLRDGMPWVPALIITLVFGAVTGLINAFFVNYMKFAPFISTLAISSVYGGLSLVITNAQNIPVSDKGFLALGSTNFWAFPLLFIITLVLLVVYGVILYATGFGRRIYMTGGNSNAARLAGIKPHKVTTILFVNTSVIASLTGAMVTSRMNMGSPSAMAGSDLDAITAVVLGGVAFTGGSGNMFGVFIGLLLISSFQNGLVVVGFDSYYQVVAKGVLLLAALVLDYYRENSRLKSLKAQQSQQNSVA